MKLLLVCHNHPDVRPGGAESYALDLYGTLAAKEEFEPLFLARSGPPISVTSRSHDGRPITQAGDDPNQYLLYTEIEQYDWFFHASREKTDLTRAYGDFLLHHRPDVVHFQHTLWLGYDIVRVTRNTLPDVPIVCTLHEYMAICHHNGQMVRTKSAELCDHESPRRCHECFPEISEPDFFMRKSFIQSHLALVDLFIAPSPWTLERYVEWGIPREKIVCETYGQLPAEPSARNAAGRDRPRPPSRFAFFGQVTPFKGVDVLLRAMKELGDDFPGHLWIHGANLDTVPESFREELGDLLEDTKATVTFVGPYEREEIGDLMARIDWVVVPSIWWETGPIVVLEAFQHGRPVICSDIGGMSEKVADGVSGLHFRRRDAGDLARVMKRAASSRRRWERLQKGIPPVHAMEDHVAVLAGHYRDLVARRSAPDAAIHQPSATVSS